MESLNLLRNWTISGRVPELDLNEGVVRFGGTVVPANSQTAWYSNQKDAFYTLAALVLFIKHADAPQSEYIRAAQQARTPFITTVERMELLAYLRGEKDSSKQIKVPFDEESTPAANAATEDSGAGSSSTKKDTSEPLPSIVGLSAEELSIAKRKVLEMISRTEQGDEDSSSLIMENPDILAYVKADRPVVTAIKKRELQVSDRNSMLRRQNKDFKFASDYYAEVRRKEKEMEREKDDGSYGKKRNRGERERQHGSSSASGSGPGSSRSNDPFIILVPSALNAMITLYNAKDFLEDGVFISTAEKKKQAVRKPTEVTIERTLPDGSKAKYLVIDNPSRLSRPEWSRVVCVIVQGAAWQFKGWEWEQPVMLFQHVLGVHVMYDDMPLESRVAGWNVRVLEVNKSKRHMDKGASLELWRWIDNFLLTNIWHMNNGMKQ